MNMKKLVLVGLLGCLCASAAWADRSVDQTVSADPDAEVSVEPGSLANVARSELETRTVALDWF